MDAARRGVPTCIGHPKDRRARSASPDAVERVNKEVKRRAGVVGVFPDDAAIVRLIGALRLGQSDGWAVSRRCFSLERPARRADNQPAVAPLALDGPVAGRAPPARVERCLAPAPFPGDAVVMGNPAAHEVAGVRAAVAATGAGILHLPPCSPGLNPSGARGG